MDSRSGSLSPEDWLEHASFLQRLTRDLVADAHDAADLAQEAWVVALEHPPRRPGSIRGWLATVATNLARNRWRSARRRQERESSAAREQTVEAGDPSLVRLEIQRVLLDLLLRLPAEQRTVLYLRYYEGLSAGAIALRLGVPLKTVKTRHTRAVKALRERLDARSGGDRRVWMEALVPLVTPLAAGLADRSPMPWVAGVTMKKLAVCAGVALLALSAWWTFGQAEVTRGVARRPDRHSDASVGAGAPAAVAGTALEAAPSLAAREPAGKDDRLTKGALDVRLSWSDGSPAAGIGLEVRSAADPAPRWETVRGRTDDRGVARFSDLHAGEVAVLPDLRQRFAAEVEAGATLTVEHTLPEGIEISGRVVAPDGKPVSAASVWCTVETSASSGMWLATMCDDDGSFRLRDVSKGATLAARARGFRPSARVRAADVPVDADGGARSVELELGPGGGRVHGRVLDPDGAPLARARVLADPGVLRVVRARGKIMATSPGPAVVETAQDGTFELPDDLEPGAQPILASARGFPVWRGEVAVTEGTSAFLEIRLERPARIEGLLLGLDDRPAAGVRVVAAHEEDGGYSWLPFPASHGTSDEAGRFVLDWVAPGACELNASSEGRPEIGRAQAKVEASAGATTTCVLRLTRGRVISGRVQAAGGAPLAGWSVHAEDVLHRWHPRSARTADDGSFTIPNLAEGRFDLVVRAPGRSVPRATLEQVPIDTQNVVLVVEDAPVEGLLRGRVVDPGGRSLSDVTAWLWKSGGGPGSKVALDAQTGAFERGARPGRYRVQFARGLSKVLTSAEFVVEEGRATDLGELELPLQGSVEVVFGGPHSGSLEAWRLSLRRYDGPEVTEELASRDGVWRSEGLEPGTWTVHLVDDERCPRGAEVEVCAGGTTRVEIPVEPAIAFSLLLAKPDGDTVVEVAARDRDGKLLRRERSVLAFAGGVARTSLALPPGRAAIEIRTDDGWRGQTELDVGLGLRGVPPTEIPLRRAP